MDKVTLTGMLFCAILIGTSCNAETETPQTMTGSSSEAVVIDQKSGNHGLMHLPLVDEANQDPEFESFRKKLIETVQNRDLEALKQATHPDIAYSFVFGGWENFMQEWKLRENPEKSGLWLALGEVLRLGGRFYDGRFWAPYVFWGLPDEFSPDYHMVIVGTGVNVRAKPNSSAEIIDNYSYAVVKAARRQEQDPMETVAGETHPWRAIILEDGRIGYIFGKYIRSPFDYRAGFEKVDGKWMMRMFLAGC